jgi:ComF family protein
MGGQYIDAMMDRPTASPGAARGPESTSGRAWAARAVALWPRQCELCRAWSRDAICTACVGRFAAPVPRCPGCAIRSDAPGLCGDCLRRPPHFDAAVAALDYAYPWDGLITRWKFHGQPELTRGLAARLVEAVRRSLDTDVDLVLPMPLGHGRLRERGYNQAWELARTASARLGIASSPDLLRRWRDTPHQVGLSRAERESNLRHALWVDPALVQPLLGRRIALVDDVMTTGASADAAARALKLAGAVQVQAWVLARTPRPG